MSSNKYKKPSAKRQQLSRTGAPVQVQTYGTTKGYSGASPSRDIPVLPLISHPLWKQSSDLRSILTKDHHHHHDNKLRDKSGNPYLLFPQTNRYEPELTPLYDYTPYVSIFHYVKEQKKPSHITIKPARPTFRDTCASTRNGASPFDYRPPLLSMMAPSTSIIHHMRQIETQAAQSQKESFSASISKGSHNHKTQSPKRHSGASTSKGSHNHQTPSPKRHSGDSTSKGSHNHQTPSPKRHSGASTSKGSHNQQTQSPKIHSGVSTFKRTYNDQPQSSRINYGATTSKEASNHNILLPCASTSSDEFSLPQKVITKSRAYPRYDGPLISHESLKVTKESCSSSKLEVPSEPEEVKKVPPPPRRHPTTFSHRWGKKRCNSSLKRASIKSWQVDGLHPPQPKPSVPEEKMPKPSRFKMMYFRGDLPVRSYPSYKGNALKWTVNIDDLDYNVFLPLFFEGLRYKEEPWCMFARQGCNDLLERHGSRVFDTVGELVKPIKDAIDTRNREVMCYTLKIVQKLLGCAPHVGRAIIPHLHAILPLLNRYLYDKFPFEDPELGLKSSTTLGDIIFETLQKMEEYGGRDAYLYIKLIVPAYQTCGLNQNV